MSALIPALSLEEIWRRAVEVSQGDPVLPIGGQQLAPWVHSLPGQAVLARLGQDVRFVRGCISGYQILSHRPSYINALLIQSRGRGEDDPGDDEPEAPLDDVGSPADTPGDRTLPAPGSSPENAIVIV
ncbi:hypothetical protein EYZ11_013175 [Aspergillus tanneri]|uniref:Uncharacterized protein n=1 Tax=Aspergillus tanneri TaxID=1220188 RepID=A0A4S3IYB7_9EURO|nr:hypothetical protein EYZ11_013175 [Aspergillus tanneri]